MTGIERLRELAVRHREIGKGLAALNLDDIANQIEREHAEDCFRMGERAADVSMSAYDLLPEEDRNAIAWVRENGGLGAVQTRVDTLRDTLDWLRERSGVGKDELVDYDELLDALDRRLMPEGMEWPRFEDGEAVRPGGKLQDKDGEWFEAVSLVFTCDWWSIRGYQTEGFGDLNDNTRRSLEGMAYGTRVKRPAPKVLDADGAEIRVGDTIYGFFGQRYEVTSLCEYEPSIVHARTVGDGVAADEHIALSGRINSAQLEASKLTHRAPVLAADGRPLREGETVYFAGWDLARTVEKVEGDSVWITGRKEPADASLLIHERPDSLERLEEDAGKDVCEYFHYEHMTSCDGCPAEHFKECSVAVGKDLVRRMRSLWERDS